MSINLEHLAFFIRLKDVAEVLDRLGARKLKIYYALKEKELVREENGFIYLTETGEKILEHCYE
jgi:Mn-dependent DtxR family transcriptional regulator